jgi:hypothetical protein
MVASVLVSKYAWHLPLYRQAQMLAVQGLDIKRSVLAFWVGYAAAEAQAGRGRESLEHRRAPARARRSRGDREESRRPVATCGREGGRICRLWFDGIKRSAPYGGVAELKPAAPEAEHARWVKPLSCYERRETTIVEGLRYG